MTIEKLLDKLARPVDYIRVGNEEDTAYESFDGFEANEIPEEVMSLYVVSWEVTTYLKQISIGEAELVYTLVIRV